MPIGFKGKESTGWVLPVTGISTRLARTEAWTVGRTSIRCICMNVVSDRSGILLVHAPKTKLKRGNSERPRNPSADNLRNCPGYGIPAYEYDAQPASLEFGLEFEEGSRL